MLNYKRRTCSVHLSFARTYEILILSHYSRVKSLVMILQTVIIADVAISLKQIL